MRVLVLAPHPFFIDRGTPIDVDILVRALSERGETVELVVYPEGEDRSYERLTIRRAAVPPPSRPRRPGFSFRKIAADLFLLIAAVRAVRQQRPDVIHAGEEAVFIAMLVKAIYRIPYVYDLDSSIAQQMIEKMPWLRPGARVFEFFEAAAIRGAVAAAPVCNALGDLVVRRGARFHVTLHDISQLTDSDFDGRDEVRAELELEGTVLAYIGNLEPYQGIDLLLESMSVAAVAAPDLNLIVAGGALEDIARYECRAKALGVAERVRFIGPWPLEKLGSLLAAADILTAPRTRGINTPMKIFPYLHSGRPVVVTDLVTHNQILTPEVAFLAEAEADAFGRALAALANDPVRRERLGLAGRAFAERGHTFRAHRRRVDNLYDHVQKAVMAGIPGR